MEGNNQSIFEKFGKFEWTVQLFLSSKSPDWMRLRGYNFILTKLEEYKNSYLMEDGYDLYKFISNNNGIITMCDFFLSHDMLYSLKEVESFIFTNNSLYSEKNYKMKKFELLINYIKITNTELYNRIYPIFTYYLGGSAFTYMFIDSLDDDSNDNLLSPQLRYYYLRSATEMDINNKELDSLKSSIIRLLLEKQRCFADDNDLYYIQKIISIIGNDNYELFDKDIQEKLKIELPIVYMLKGNKKLLSIDVEKNTIDEDEIFAFCRYAEKFYKIEDKKICNIRLWDFFDVSKETYDKMFKIVVDHEIRNIETFLKSDDKRLERIRFELSKSKEGMNLLSLSSSLQNDTNLDVILAKMFDWDDAPEPELIIMLGFYYLLKNGASESNKKYTIVDFLSLLLYSGYRVDSPKGRVRLYERLNRGKFSITIGAITAIGLYEPSLIQFTTLLAAAIPIIRDIRLNDECKIVKNEITETYNVFKDKQIRKFVNDKGEFGQNFYTYYPAFLSFKNLITSFEN